MQSTHKVPGSSAMRWSKYLVSEASRGDYYTHDGDGNRAAPTQWHGSEELLRSYGIDPDKAVELKHLRPLMHGFDPVKKVAIRPAGSDKTRVAAVDLTYSAPKDVSALWATSSPYRRAQIEVAHKQAVKSALERTEREVTVVRRKQNKVQRFETAKGLISAEALHTTSRLGKDQDADGIPDPQLHSHIAVIAAQRRDGKMAAVESRQLMLSAREGGAWYRSELAANLRELGVDIERRAGNDGRYFDVRGVSKELSEHWSKRGQEVNRAAEAFRRKYNREPGPGELDNMVLSTRGSKSAARPDEISAAWQALGEEHGLTAKRSEELFHSQHLENKPIDLREELLAEITKDQATINTHELKAKAYELSTGVCRPADADKLVDELVRSGTLCQLKDRTWTTRHHREPKQPTTDIPQPRATEIAAPVSERSPENAEREIAGQTPQQPVGQTAPQTTQQPIDQAASQTPQAPIEQTVDTPQRIDEIEHRADAMRQQGADEITIVKQIAKEQPSDPDARPTRTTREEQRREREIAAVVEQQRQRRLDEEQRLIDRHHAEAQEARTADANRDRMSGDRPSPIVEPDTSRDSYIEAAIQEERDRQQAWQRDTEPDRDRDPQQPIQEERDRQQAWQRGAEPDRGVQPERDRDIQQAIQEERDRQENWERGIDQDHDVDRPDRPDSDSVIEQTIQEEQLAVREIGNFIEEIRQRHLDQEHQNDRNEHNTRDPARYIDQPGDTGRDPHIDQPQPANRDQRKVWEQGIEPARTNEPNRDLDIQQAIQEEQDRQENWERGIDSDRDNERQPDQPTPAEPAEHSTDPDPDIDRPGRADRDPLIEQAIQEERDRQENWERGIDQDRDNDRGFGIE